MSDHNDFFEEFINVDEETETAEAELFDEDEDDEAEEDEELLEVRTAVLVKNEMLALLSLKVTQSGAMIVRLDPRETLPSAQRYDDGEAALKWFRRSLSTSKKNGWNVVYEGQPLAG